MTPQAVRRNLKIHCEHGFTQNHTIFNRSQSFDPNKFNGKTSLGGFWLEPYLLTTSLWGAAAVEMERAIAFCPVLCWKVLTATWDEGFLARQASVLQDSCKALTLLPVTQSCHGMVPLLRLRRLTELTEWQDLKVHANDCWNNEEPGKENKFEIEHFEEFKVE